MGNCVCCGMDIPDGQSTCSMCYGDPYHGSDGYYLQWLEEQDRQQEAALQAEQEMLEQMWLNDKILADMAHNGD